MSWSVNGFLCFLGLASPALAWQQLEGRDRPGNGLARPCGSSFYCAKQKKLLLINPLQLLVGKLFTIPSAEVPRNVLFELTGGRGTRVNQRAAVMAAQSHDGDKKETTLFLVSLPN